MLYADVIVDISHENLDKTYQYRVPESLREQVSVGCPVRISFGNGHRSITGYVVGLSTEPKLAEEKIKEIDGVVEKGVVIESRMIALAHWMKENFGGTMNDSLRTVLSVKKSVRPVEKKTITLLADDSTVEELITEAERKHYTAKERFLRELKKFRRLDKGLVTGTLNVSAATLQKLEQQGIISTEVEEVYRNPVKELKRQVKSVLLNEEQQAACDTVCNEYRAGKRGVYLLHGVTGSGKTEVYLCIIEEILKEKKQVIVLIPEIALTYQTVRRFTERFGERVAFLHSRLSQGERYDQYRKAKEGKIDIMIGPRSALFTPFEHLGLIVIDEEHERSYKSESVPKYHARETAVELAKMTNASVLLGSATPSLESYQAAMDGKYTLLKLTRRANNAKLPSVKIIDLKEELKAKNRSMFSRELLAGMEERLKKKEQVMLFLNRRGYSGFVSCRSCGKALMCPHCAVSLTAHVPKSPMEGQTLHCHYCGYSIPMPKECPSCGSPYIAAFGTGTQKVEEAVRKQFPAARVLRMDADTTKEKDSYEKILSAFSKEEADILIGTQMIVKGHDFPKVTLVGILAADLSLNVSDYRSSERTFQLLAQAAGRAGRGERAGEVLIQTYQPEHYSIVAAATEDYEGFFRQEIAYRELLKYPPKAHILAALCVGKQEELSSECADFLAAKAREFIKAQNDRTVIIIGPAAAGLSKANDFYRNLVYFKAASYDILTELASYLENGKENEEQFKSVILQLDFDPMNSY
ncbi:MAG: primosomal protein N' [Lachnospiraceae bacterium]